MKFEIDGKEIEIKIFDPKDDYLNPGDLEQVETLD